MDVRDKTKCARCGTPFWFIDQHDSPPLCHECWLCFVYEPAIDGIHPYSDRYLIWGKLEPEIACKLVDDWIKNG